MKITTAALNGSPCNLLGFLLLGLLLLHFATQTPERERESFCFQHGWERLGKKYLESITQQLRN